MRDGVADVLAQRARLNRGAGTGVLISAVLHAGLTALLVYTAMQTTAPKPVGLVNIRFAPISSAAPAAAPSKPKAAVPKPVPPKIEEPKPVVETPAPKVEKNTVPVSPFGQSTKKGSETPAVAKPKPAPPAPAVPGAGAAGTTTDVPDVPIGGSGVTGLEGGDFPYTIYIQGMQRRIGSNWFRPQIANGAAAVIYFRIQRDGTIAEAKVESSSGNGTFDRAALSAVKSSSPLNRLPNDYVGPYLGVHLAFR
ncbi:MAG TPA: TonB family protein [Thermoanaerobaculia bacterium]|nr:TonB family protein [Thermoanaerobaculia bacterium]